MNFPDLLKLGIPALFNRAVLAHDGGDIVEAMWCFAAICSLQAQRSITQSDEICRLYQRLRELTVGIHAIDDAGMSPAAAKALRDLKAAAVVFAQTLVNPVN